MSFSKPLESCHDDICDGLNEVVKLLPRGSLWDVSRESTYSSTVKALGAIKSEWNARICQEWRELDPCTSIRLLDYWAQRFGFPDCVELTSENLCCWIDLINDPRCPPQTIGFVRKFMEFIGFDNRIHMEFNPSASCECTSGARCFCDNLIIFTAPPNLFYYDHIVIDYPLDPVDGENQCRSYFLPQLDCLKRYVLPPSASIGYRTNPAGPNGELIYNVPDCNQAVNPHKTILDSIECQLSSQSKPLT